MAVDTSIYGSADQWINTAFYDKFYHNKKAYFNTNQSQLGQGVTANKLSYETPIDKSLSYCGLGTESALSHVRYVQNVSNTATIIDSQDRFQTNFLFGEITTRTGLDGNYTALQLSDLKYRKAWQTSFDTDTWWSSNKNKLVEPYTSIHPKSVVFLIYVIASNANFTDSINVTLSEYRSQYTSYPNISQVYIVPYMNVNIAASESSPTREPYGAAGSITGDYRLGFCLGLLDEYEIPSRNFSMYSYQLTYYRIVMGNLYSVETSERNTATAIVYVPENVGDHFKYQRVRIVDTYYIRTYIEYYEGIFDEILKTVACFGLYFTEKTNVARYGLFTNNDMYIGLLDENGIGHGEYLRGADTVNAPQNEYTDMSQSGYDYTKDVDKTKYKNDTEFYDSTLANGFTRFWVLDANGVSQVLHEMYNIMNDVDPDEPIERYSQKVFLTNNPIDCIISLKKFPVLHIPSLSGAYFVNFGSKATSISAYPLSKSCETYTFNFSAANDTSLYPVFGGDFRDFEPYTKCEIVIPFCGSVDVPCCYFYEYGGITVKLTIDFISGACTGFVLANGITISSVSGNCAIDLPVSGIQSATLDSQIFSAAQAKKQNFNKTRAGLVASALTATAGAITGNPVMVAAGAAGVLATAISSKETVKNIDYELQHLQTPYKEVSTASGQISQSFDMRCKLIITRPKMLTYDENAYAETVGYACLNSGSVDSFHGLTYGTIELNGVPCTADEKSYIESMFANGVHLPTTYP